MLTDPSTFFKSTFESPKWPDRELQQLIQMASQTCLLFTSISYSLFDLGVQSKSIATRWADCFPHGIYPQREAWMQQGYTCESGRNEFLFKIESMQICACSALVQSKDGLEQTVACYLMAHDDWLLLMEPDALKLGQGTLVKVVSFLDLQVRNDDMMLTVDGATVALYDRM